MNWNHHGGVFNAARGGAKRWLGLLALVLLGQAPVAQAACDPSISCCAGAPATGSPCGGAGVATLGNTSGTNSGAGNPINLLGGNKFQREVDMPALPGVLGLELVRYYNSADSERHLLGRGWRLSYETTLRVGTGALAGAVEIVQADGTRIAFALPPDQRQGQGQGDLYRGLNPLQGLVRRLDTPRGSEYLWRWADGRQLRFNTKGQLEQIRMPSGEFLSLRYDGRGWLMNVIDPAGRRLSVNVLDKAGAKDTQRYRGIQSIDTPVGRFRYEHGGALPEGSSAKPGELVANLSQVIYPRSQPSDGATSLPTLGRLYHYEDPRFPTLLTGISAQVGTQVRGGEGGQVSNERLSTWAYDEERRAILSFKGERSSGPSGGMGQEQVSLQHGPTERGQSTTVLTNSMGQTTVYTSTTIAGEPRLLQAIGPGCSSCGPGNVRYGYDRVGRLTEETTLDEKGQPLRSTRTELDAYGRPVKVSTVTYENGKAQPAQARVRYEYAAMDARDPYALPSPQPVLIAVPSVVSGRERITRITYNAAQQPVEVTEEGFSPVDEQGVPTAQGVSIARTLAYRYATANGRSVLQSIDGPLPDGASNSALNGADDADITRLEWDPRGDHLKAFISPGGLRTSITTDPDTGRIAQFTGPDGVTNTPTYTPGGDLISLTRRRSEVVLSQQRFRYDANGRPIESFRRIGERDAPQTRQAFDAAGRLLWQADALGVLRLASYDTEGHLLSSRVVGAGIDQQERYSRDAQGRLLRVDDNSGGHRELVRDEAGRLIATVDPLGRWTRYERDTEGLRTVQSAHTGKPLVLRYGSDAQGNWRSLSAEAHDDLRVVRRAMHRRLVDDFGREVLVENPDSGRELRRFDAADRLVRVLQADGGAVDFAYDARGRMVRRNATAPPAAQADSGHAPQTVRYLYEGTRLVEIRAPEQGERYAYDDQGRVDTATITLRLNDGRLVQNTTRYRYDAMGRLAAQSLPDGSELRFERNGQGQVVALRRQTGPSWAPFGWGRTTLAQGLQRDLVGLTRLRYGNGIEGRWQRSREGVLARVVYGAAPDEAHALWDSRLRFDAAGNVLVQGQFADSAAAQPAQTVLAYDAQDQLVQALRTGIARNQGVGVDAAQSLAVWRYHHDSLGNRLLAQQAQVQPQAVQGPAATYQLAYAPDSNQLRGPVLDAAGRVLQDGGRRYAWDSLGRLISVTQDGVATRYRYNHRGQRISKQGRAQQHYLYDGQRHRIAELDAHGRLTRQYVWLGDQLLAVIDPPQPLPLRAPAEGVFESLWRTAQTAWERLSGAAPSIHYVHVNHLGAPVAATDERGRTTWAADYAPFGQRLASQSSGFIKTATGQEAPSSARGLRLDLRLPGQWEDEETGLYYNDQRYYDPQAGRYLSSDPLGLAGGLNAYAYAGNNPLGFADPLGLVLFAFDGTGNSFPPPGNDDISNVRKFFLTYNDGARWYMNGVGRPDPDSGIGTDWAYSHLGGQQNDLARASTARERVDYMLGQLDGYIRDTAPADQWIDLDIVGFSRGAAMARDFANRVSARMAQQRWGAKSECVNLRYLGLWDTVAQFGLNGAQNAAWQLAVPDDVQYAAQAVALNEHRYLFPSELIGADSTNPDALRITRGFIGSHSDIGGSYASGDLSDVALIWMVEQARAAGVEMDTLTEVRPEWAQATDPLLHDKNTVVGNSNAIDETGDRDACLRANNEAWADRCVKQKRADYGPDSLRHPDTAQFITRSPEMKTDGDGESRIVGTVNMKEYAQWLKQHYGIDVGY